MADTEESVEKELVDANRKAKELAKREKDKDVKAGQRGSKK